MGMISKYLGASTLVLLCGAAAILFHIVRKRKLQKTISRRAEEVFTYLDINIVTTAEDCDYVVHQLRSRSMTHKALGFDCEWVTERSRQPVALLQLSSFDGYCGLFRLNCFPQRVIPNSLKELLQCEDIYKVGVAPLGDQKYIYTDYQATVRATIDLRFIAEMCGYKPAGLAAMSEATLGVALDKRWRTRCSNWEAEELSPRQVHYAASDAHSAIRIFVAMLTSYNSSLRNIWSEDVWERIEDVCWNYQDRNYKAKHDGQRTDGGNSKKEKRKEKGPKRPYCVNATRSKPLYQNCFLQAPDGELLCTCDNKKAFWYIDKGLAVLISEAPLTVRLIFEPVARSTGDVGKYYTMKKENHCVVCGATNSYIRKNVVPREYRRLFPEVMKDHSSHDVLLLCVPCHQRSNILDQGMRRRLAEKCDAPLAHDNPKQFEDATLKKVRTAARALLFHTRNHALPMERRKELESVVLAQFPDRGITDALLEEAASLQHTTANEDYTTDSHGYRVVSKYLECFGGLLTLEEEWRQHFLTTMSPRHMPHLWSVHHNRERLKVKLDENRLNLDDLKLIGCI